LTKREKCAPKQAEKGSETQQATSCILNTLISPSNADTGRISRRTLAEQWINETVEHREKQIKQWLTGGRCPDDFSVWEIGEHLRHLGCPWISGLWLLFACGRFARYVQIVSIMLAPGKKYSRDLLDTMWHMLVTASVLSRPTVLDVERPFIDYFLRKRGLDDETVEAIDSWKDAALKRLSEATEEEMLYDPPASLSLISETVTAFLKREAMKVAWNDYDEIKKDVDDAARAAFRETPIPTAPYDHLMRATFAAADALEIPMLYRAQTVLTLMGHWFNCLEGGYRIVRLPRDIDEPYRSIDLLSYMFFPRGGQHFETPGLDLLLAKQDPMVWGDLVDDTACLPD
jgi:hypothetical protein